MQLFELKKQQKFALEKADKILAAAESANRQLTAGEQADLDTCTTAAQALGPQIAKLERNNSIRQHLVEGKLVPAAGNLRQGRLDWHTRPTGIGGVVRRCRVSGRLCCAGHRSGPSDTTRAVRNRRA
jgi:hypothetical protein